MKILKYSLALFFLTAIAYMFFAVGSIPDEIKLRQNTSGRINVSFPLDISVEPETIRVINVTNARVTENISITQARPFTIQAEDIGTASITFNALGIPIKRVKVDVRPDIEVIPCGMTVGVRINTDGIMVLGTGFVNTENGDRSNPCEGKLISGDLLLSANGQTLNNKEDLVRIVEDSNGTVNFTLKRNMENIELAVEPVKSADTRKNKIGLWVRDSVQGIGTVTYYNPNTNGFAALGHGIVDIDTKKLINIKTGSVVKSQIVSVKKGDRGIPGELVGEISHDRTLGSVTANSAYGIFGTADYSLVAQSRSNKMPIALQAEIHEGPARILSNVEGEDVRSFDIYIESVNRLSTDDSKGMVIRITDPELLRITGGIVQGMSGSPIIQDEKLVGAVTHVFVQNPTRGYGIFIENMLSNETGQGR